jgi:uncharacterized Tic20 family protein
VHPTLGILARFQAFFYASAFSQSDSVPPPAPARVTQTVRRYSKANSGRKSMRNDLDTTTNCHIYKQKRWLLSLNVFSLVFIGIVLGIPLIGFVAMLISLFRAESKLDTVAIIFACFLFPMIILLSFILFRQTINVVLSFFSYTKISPDGIEQKQLPYKHIRCAWSDVDKLGKLFLTDVIYLTSYEVIGLSLSLKSPFRFFRPKQGFMSLSGYDGWPDGQLSDDLKLYAPKLFEVPPIPQKAQPDNKDFQSKNASNVSQESRLLVALSHASVIFSYMGGFIVPIVIYATQKKKFSYIGFQALQALIWQIVAFIFNMVAPTCMVGIICIPIFIAAFSGNEKTLGLFTGGVFLITIASTFLLLLSNLAFINYGIIGAIMTYQGKDFRYVIIANRLVKGKAQKSVKSA